MGSQVFTYPVMKFLLTMQICSLIAGDCNHAIQRVMPFNSYHECIIAGHSHSMDVYKTLGSTFVNSNQTYVQFYCTKSKST